MSTQIGIQALDEKKKNINKLSLLIGEDAKPDGFHKNETLQPIISLQEQLENDGQDIKKEEEDLLLMHAKQIIEQLLKSDKPELDWRISEYLCKDEIIHLLLSYISRLPSHINIHQIHSIYINQNNCALKWINNTLNAMQTDDNILYIDQHRDKADNDRLCLLQTEQNNISQINELKQEESDEHSASSSSDNIEDLFELSPDSVSQKQQQNEEEALRKLVHFEKLSFSLMKILCNSYAPKTVQSFLLRKIKCIIFHSLIVFHPLSYGNIYHSAEILNILLFYWPKQLFQVLTTSNCICIKYLFKYAIISRIHQWKFSEFVINLLCYNNNAGNEELQQSINKYRSILIDEMLIKWHFLGNIMLIACSPVQYGEDISNKYCLFLFNLLKKCALIKETKNLFVYPENMLCLIIDKLLRNILDQTLDLKWYKINCCFTLREIIKYLSKPTILQVITVPKSQGMTGITTAIASENNIYPLFKSALDKFAEYVPLIINEIITNKNSNVNSDKSKKTLGLHRLNCIELLMLYIDIIKIENDSLPIANIDCLCRALLDMVFVFDEHSIFLAKFRMFVSIMNVHWVEQLEYMFIECRMVHRFMEYYNSDGIARTALHAYIVQILYEIYEYHEGLYAEEIEDEWNFVKYIKQDQNMMDFMQMINTQVEENEPDDDI